MGEPPFGYEIGDNCDICWGVGKEFDDVPTPKFVWAYFFGIKLDPDPACAHLPDPTDGVRILMEQDPVHPGHWAGGLLSGKPPAMWLADFSLFLGSSRLVGTIGGGIAFFSDIVAVKCITSFSSSMAPPNCYYGGNGVIS